MAVVNSFTAFDGRVVFHTRPTCLSVHLEFERLRKLVEGITHEVKEAPGAVTNLLFYIASTKEIEFHFQGNETDLLSDFKAMWEGIRPYSVESITAALDWALYGASAIREQWDAAVEQDNTLWIDPVEAPKAHLTPEQQKELDDPTSPLAPSGANAKKQTSAA